MWFKFPAGVDQISVEQQLFAVEVKDEAGAGFFRAPDVFAPTILNLPGFARADPPEGAPEDLPPVDPKRAEAVDKLSAEVESLREENQRLRQELGAARRERDALQTQLDDFEAAEVVGAEGNKVKEVLKPTPGAASTAQPPTSKETAHASTAASGSTANKSSGR